MKKIVSVLLSLLIFVSFNAIGQNFCKHDTIRILAIGNSFSVDAVEQHLYQIAKADSIELIIGNLYIGGCSLKRHYTNISFNFPDYEYHKIKNEIKTDTRKCTLEKALTDEKWDYVSLQQVSYDAGDITTFKPYLGSLIRYVQNRLPKVKFIYHMTWAYARNSTHKEFPKYSKSQSKMYFSIVSTTQEVLKTYKQFNLLVPSGTAIQNMRAIKKIGDSLCRDGYHLNYNFGRYTAACTWYEAITGNNVTKNTYIPLRVSEFERKAAQQAAHYAVLSPFTVTDLNGKITELIDAL